MRIFKISSALTLLAISSISLASPSARDVTSCGGTEPFWDLKLGPSQIEFSDLGVPTMTIASHPARTARGHMEDYIALYQGKVMQEEGRYMNVIITKAACSDGMSDTEYPFEVLVLSGTELYRGCCY